MARSREGPEMKKGLSACYKTESASESQALCNSFFLLSFSFLLLGFSDYGHGT